MQVCNCLFPLPTSLLYAGFFMPAYYNEIDPSAAQWLRNLIKAGHIAPGDVDERSIEDVYPSDLRGYTQCHFFAGIGVWSHALRSSGWSDDRPVWSGSCPCQPFSAAGKGAGFDDKRHLWPAFNHLIQEYKPAIVFGEQVASKDGLTWLDLVLADLEAQGYAAGAVDTCSAGFGAPHIRQRLYWVANANNAGLEGWQGVQQRTNQCATGKNIVAGRMANTQQHDSGREAEPANHGKPKADRPADWTSGCGGTSGGMADAESARPSHGGGGRLLAIASEDGRDAVIRMANTNSDRCQPGREGIEAMGHGQAAGSDSGACRPSPTNGFWRDVDWLGCRDEKWRPVEPSSFPLAYGSAARVVRLRAYGNAINAKAAQGFIEAVMDYQSTPNKPA